MAIYHLSMKPIARSLGRSAVAAAAYRAAVKLTNERDGITHDFSRRQGVEHAEIVLPEGVAEHWARDRSALWNAAERIEPRKDARVAREFEVALPHELSAEQRLALTREFAQMLADRHGAAVDFAIHLPQQETGAASATNAIGAAGATRAGDVRNVHAHVMMTTRQVTVEGLSNKTYLERENKWLLSNDLPTSQMQLKDIRQSWEHIANQHLARAGFDIRIDHRSHQERGLEIEPTEHMGVHATQMERQGKDVSRVRIDERAAMRNADLIREKPEQILVIITQEKSVFDRHDVARALHRYINDDVQAFQNAFASVMASPALVELQPERTDVLGDAATGEIELARYSTREMVEIERAMAESADRMGRASGHGANRRHVDMAIRLQDDAIKASARASLSERLLRGEISHEKSDGQVRAAGLSAEQRAAIEHITGPEQMAVVVGFAGAGKSTMLAAARAAWEAEGYRVHGAALSGKAAEGLEESSGIESRTLASWEYGWQAGRGALGNRDVFVIDEAGMVGSRQLARFVEAAENAGAKLVLVGDHEQLQAIGAGAPFRAIAERIGHAELSEIRRQRVGWQRQASVALATHKTAEGLAAYRQHGDIRFSETGEGARAEIVRDYLADRNERPDGSRVAMAHRRIDVRTLNAEIRTALQDRGELARGEGGNQGDRASLGRELVFQTNDGKRSFAPGDRIVFLENNRDLGVKNGMLGTVEHAEADRIDVLLDVKGDSISVSMGDYKAIDHGYATTIHKNQGATVDRAFVLASGTMDRHLTYVAMTRHRDGMQLYVGQDEFVDRNAGRLVAHGRAPYENDPKQRASYYVTVETDGGKQHTVWGVDVERALAEAAPEIGDRIGLEHVGSDAVRLPDGQVVERNVWKVHRADDLTFQQLEGRLRRAGLKETTLDYVRGFAERRGIAEEFGVRSEIEVGAEKEAPRHGVDVDKPAPLVPANMRYDRSIDEIAREKAMPSFDRAWDVVGSLVKLTFADADAVMGRLRSAILDQNADDKVLETAIADQPERFGNLLGRVGVFGDSKERKEARGYAKSVASHVGSAVVTWQRRLGEEISAGQWQRDKRDLTEVPGLTSRSAEILAEVDRISVAERNGWVETLRSTPEGRQALSEAKVVGDALRQRFGHSDPRKFGVGLERDASLGSQVEVIRRVARTVERVRMAELSRDHAIKQELSRNKGLGLSR